MRSLVVLGASIALTVAFPSMGCRGGIVGPSSGGGPASDDVDGDGYRAGIDCNDRDAAINPGAVEICGDGIDQDCSGADGACTVCGGTAVPETGCLCGGGRHTNGYCCDGVWQGTECTCQAPTFSPTAGAYTGALSVTVSTPTPGATIYCGTDNPPRTLCTEPLSVTASTTVYAVVEKAGYASASSSAHYTINAPCPQGPIESQCDCGGTLYSAGFCCWGAYGTAACPTARAMTTAHRTRGVAPLAVFFDAVDNSPAAAGTAAYYAAPFPWSSGVAQPADLEGAIWEWSFGDPGSGMWATTGKSKNVTTGYTAAPVFETPGAYTVTLTVTDTGGVAHTYTQSITVDDPDVVFAGRTYYVATNGNDRNSGVSMSSPFASVGKAIERIVESGAPGERILFRRGDTFTAAATYHNIRSPGPGIIGSYSDGSPGHGPDAPRPVIHMPNTCVNAQGEVDPTYTFQLSDGADPFVDGRDWRFMDLDLVGPGQDSGTTCWAIGVNQSRQTSNLLQLRNLYRQWGSEGIHNYRAPNTMDDRPTEGIFLVENEVRETGVIGAYGGGYRIAWLGNYVHHGGRSHSVRCWLAHHGVYSNNHFEDQGGNRHTLKQHSPNKAAQALDPQQPLAPDSQFISISDNIFTANRRDSATNPDNVIWNIGLGPQDSGNDERVSHVIVERNLFRGTATNLSSHVESNASNAIFRNNILAMGTTTNWVSAFLVTRRGIEPAPVDVRIYNNTIYTPTTSEAYAFEIRAEVSDVRVRNNLVSFPGGGSLKSLWYEDNLLSNVTQDHNLFSTASPRALLTDAEGGEFSLPPGSEAIDSGVVLPDVREDFTRKLRTGQWDAGAFER